MALYRDNHYGFARYDHSNVDAEIKTNQVLAEVDRIVDRGEPASFLWVHYFDVHEPYEDTSLGTSDMDRYDGEIRKTDREIGRLLAGLRERLERPLIIALTAAACFALANSITVVAYRGGSNPLTVTGTRFILPTLLLIIILRAGGISLILPRATGLAALALGVLVPLQADQRR